MQIQCPQCQGSMEVGPELIGRSVRCPHCRQELAIAADKGPGPPIGAPAPGAGSAAAAECPSCGAVLQEGDAICMTCGFDRRTGRVHTAAVAGFSTAWSDPRGVVDQTPAFDLSWDHVTSRRLGFFLGFLLLVAAGVLMLLGAAALERVIGLAVVMIVLALVAIIGAACPPTVRGFLYAATIALPALGAVIVIPPPFQLSGFLGAIGFVACVWAIGGASIAHQLRAMPHTRWAALGPALVSAPLAAIDFVFGIASVLAGQELGISGMAMQGASIGVALVSLLILASQVFALLQGILPRVGGLYWAARVTFLLPIVVAVAWMLIAAVAASSGAAALVAALVLPLVATFLFIAMSGYGIALRSLLLRFD
jgi:hypothetical protein